MSAVVLEQGPFSNVTTEKRENTENEKNHFNFLAHIDL